MDALKTPDVFSMCLSETVGAMVLGGAIPVPRAALELCALAARARAERAAGA